MTISRLLVLQALLFCGLGTVFFIPREEKIQPSRVDMNLPENILDWDGRPAEVTQAERDKLAADTQFSRKVYADPFGDQVYVSIVMSGQDLDNSIHRPERCLPAQGWTIVQSNNLNLPVPSAPGGVLPVTRLYNVQQVETKDGRVIPVYSIDYYWFVGSSDITASHFSREFIDIKDRLVHGYNQHWAYITVTSTVTEGIRRFGKSGQRTDEMLQKLIAELYPKIILAPHKG